MDAAATNGKHYNSSTKSQRFGRTWQETSKKKISSTQVDTPLTRRTKARHGSGKSGTKNGGGYLRQS